MSLLQTRGAICIGSNGISKRINKKAGLSKQFGQGDTITIGVNAVQGLCYFKVNGENIGLLNNLKTNLFYNFNLN